MISSKTLTALIGVALVMLTGCRGQEPPKTLAECHEGRTREIRSVLSGLRNIAPEGTDDAHWFEQGVKYLEQNDLPGYVRVLQVGSRSVRQALSPLEAPIRSINLKYDKYEAALSGKPWPPVEPAIIPPPDPLAASAIVQPPAGLMPGPIVQPPAGMMPSPRRALAKGESEELRVARAQLATAKAKVRLEAARGGSPEAQKAAAQELARLSQLVSTLLQKELSELEATTQPSATTAQALYQQAIAEFEVDSDKSEKLLIQARKILEALEPLSPDDYEANNLKTNISSFETNIFRPEKLFKLAQYYKSTDPARAGLYLKGALNTVLNVNPDQEFVRRLIPLFKELFPDESTEELEAFAAGKPSPRAEAEKRQKEAEALRKRQAKALQYYHNALGLKTPNPKAAKDYLRQALELDPDEDLRRKIHKLREDLERSKGKE
jgi:hypothetical protein